MTQSAASSTWVEVEVAGIRRGPRTGTADPKHVMLLAERGGPRRLPVWIGPGEAIALALSLESAEMPRPLTYQLAASLLGAAGGRVTGVRITQLAGQVYYATVVVDGPAGIREVDARPSDAVNLAVVTGAPVLADSVLLAEAAERGAPAQARWEEMPADAAQIVAEQRERLAAQLREPE